MSQQSTGSVATTSAHGSTAATDLFALTDEQILEIAPEAQDVEVSDPPSESVAGAQPAAPTDVGTKTVDAGPFAAPEEVRALAELYPGGLNQAKTAAERARSLDEIDAAYFGGAASTPEQVSAARAQLAQRMMNENPAAFREMVFAGLRALGDLNAPPASGAASGSASAAPQAQSDGLKPAPTQASGGASNDSQTAAYATFERGANEELERSVGSAIERTIAQALPNLGKGEGKVSAGTRTGMSLRERLASSVRQDVEAALKGDRQLGEQVAQILAARRFDETSRAQVVRLIGERAQQLVPGATRRVINEWTGTTLAAHGAKSERSIASSARREVSPAVGSSSSASPTRTQGQSRDRQDAGATKTRSVNYRKLSDAQILDL